MTENYMKTKKFRELHRGTIRYEAVRLGRALNALAREIVEAFPPGIVRKMVATIVLRRRKK